MIIMNGAIHAPTQTPNTFVSNYGTKKEFIREMGKMYDSLQEEKITINLWLRRK